jgi:6-phosphogluconate dehydrogenase
MDVAMVGLGRMGLNMANRMVRGGHRVVAYDLDAQAVQTAVQTGAEGLQGLDDIRKVLAPPRVIWVMVPAGSPTEDTLKRLVQILSRGDIIIDGGNSNYKDTMRRAAALKEQGLVLVDAGTSGGIWGLQEGYSMMVGGEKATVDYLSPLFSTLAPAPDKGWGYVGPSGAGHFVKMVHNGIEYGLMEAYAEGFDILRAKKEYGLDLHRIAEIWRYGSVVRSWLLDLIAAALAEDKDLGGMEAWVADSGEGRWTVSESIDLGIPAPVISLALEMRLVSRHTDSFAAKMLAAMRNRFGGHPVRKTAH